MSRFFLHISSTSDERNHRGGALDEVRRLFGELDAPVWYDFSDGSSSLLIGGHDKAIYTEGFSFCTGVAFRPDDSNSFSDLTRSGFTSLSVFCDDQQLIVASNLVAGRTAWYYFDGSCFILSSSQRAIVRFLGSFQFNEDAMAWMLATGNLGPGNSWDRRFKHVRSNTRIVLSRQLWHLSQSDAVRLDRNDPVAFFEDCLAELDHVLNDVFTDVKYNKSFDILSLSGGYDSRLVLNKMKAHFNGLDTFTWGLSSARNEKNTDAYIAKNLAEAAGVSNIYFETDFHPKDFSSLIDKYLRFGEGRIDHINFFMGGLSMWQQLALSGYRFLYRADEVFGWLPCATEKDVRISLDYHLMHDNSNMLPFRNFNLPEQNFPDRFNRLSDESLAEWRDRLYRNFRVPHVLTGLHDVGSSYVEVFNPLLHDSIVRFCMSLPDLYRTHKKLYVESIGRFRSNVPVAMKPSIPEPGAILRSSRFISHILDEFREQKTRNLFGSDFLSWIEKHLHVDDGLMSRTNDSLWVWLQANVPWQLKKMIRRDILQYRSDFNQLAFRVLIISRMRSLFESDSASDRTDLNLSQF